MTIKVLDKDTANKIAAGEVITDPAAVVKELVENSIDAHSTRIDIAIKDGGKKSITVTDNGDGIDSHEVILAFDRHATSKINHLKDLSDLTSLGFRGEALASIAAISKITMKTQSRYEELGSIVKLVDHHNEINRKSFSRGTSISVEDIFYNMPARLKHMKKGNDLSKDITQLVESLALSHPDISFSLLIEDKSVIKTPGDNNLHNTIYSMFGSEYGDNLITINYENKPLRITGYMGKSNYTRNNRKQQYTYINNRYVQDAKISRAVEEAYENTIMINQHPVFVLNIDIPPHMLDVNVHPSKTKIKILNESLILLLIKDGIKKNVSETSTVKKIEPKIDRIMPVKVDYVQEALINSMPAIKENKVEEINFMTKDIELDSIHDTEPKMVDTRNGIGQKNEMSSSIVKNQNALNNQLDRKKETDFSKNFLHTTLVGQLFCTYILFEGEDFILLMDQHAAHERILYEDISRKLKEGEKLTQQIIPRTVQLTPSEYQMLMNKEEVFCKIGFEFEEYGDHTICIRGVPIFSDQVQDTNLLMEIIQELDNKLDFANITKFEETIIKKACKKAIKANKKLTQQEIQSLIAQLIQCDYPYTCPHGRPTLIKLTKTEFEKHFKRIQ